MLNQLMSAIVEYRLVIMVVTLLVLVLLAKKRIDGPKLFLVLAATLAVSIIYELVMDEPVSRIPARINQALNQPGPTKSTNPHYYTTPENRQLPGE